MSKMEADKRNKTKEDEMSSARNHAKRSRYSYQAIPFDGIRRTSFIRNESRNARASEFGPIKRLKRLLAGRRDKNTASQGDA